MFMRSRLPAGPCRVVALGSSMGVRPRWQFSPDCEQPHTWVCVRRSDDCAAHAAYAGPVKPKSSIVPVVRSALPTLATAWWQGLLTVLAGRDPGPPWGWRSRQQRWAAYVGLAVVSLALSLADGGTQSPNQLLLGLAGTAPLLLIVRYPLLGWRIAWLALLLTPLADARWRGGCPLGPGQIVGALAAVCLP